MYIEPDANIREGAHYLRSLHNSYRESGFTEEQAFEMTKIVVTEMYRSIAKNM